MLVAILRQDRSTFMRYLAFMKRQLSILLKSTVPKREIFSGLKRAKSNLSACLLMLYHKNTELRASDAVSAIRGYHNQQIRFQSLLQYFTYITSHDAYRMHHPGAPRAALTKKPPKQKEPPRKGTKRWHKEQTRRRAAERRRAIRNVLALIDSLDAGYAACPAV